MKRVTRFGVFQTAKVVAIIYFFMVAIFMIPLILFMLAMGGEVLGFPLAGGFAMIVMPFIYGAVAFVGTAIGCLIYNFIAGYTGGIEIEVEVTDPAEL